jgi:hypothetical protein
MIEHRVFYHGSGGDAEISLTNANKTDLQPLAVIPG